MMDKAYVAGQVESDIYRRWEEAKAFSPSGDTTAGSFCISMPPPNATGQLHLGHAVMLAIEDIMTRYARLKGKNTLWLPGTDHAAIATETLVIRNLQKNEKIADPRQTLGREKVLERIVDYIEHSRATIREQVRQMGSSCDWSRESYTMQDSLSRVVREVFVKMYRDGLIYRGPRLVNWDPKMQTTVSDDELEHVEEKAKFYYFKFGPFTIGTARPETKFGDKYVVVHPDDARYAQYQHGQTFAVEWINGPIVATLLKDAAVDPEFGTGAMTITPWHDAVDFEMAERHQLDRGQQVIGYDGKLLALAGEFVGMDIQAARPLIVEKLQAKGLLVKVDDHYLHKVAVSYRGKGMIEPQIREQWFIAVNKPVSTWQGKWTGQSLSLKQVLQQVVREGDIRILPKRFDKTYFHWIDNLRDWCISRQIWWGHRIPVWTRGSEVFVGVNAPAGEAWLQDPDTLDTWFSSALWTWSTLIDPALAADPALSLTDLLQRSPDFQTFHPTTVMETGYDILFFWVARMILMTTYNVGQIPFETVYLHGLVRTRDGKKMSKSSPETSIDPLDMIQKYGADALRLALVVGQTPGNDTKLYEEKIAGYRNFCNKLWNASRFVLDSKPDAFYAGLKLVQPEWKDFTPLQQWILGELAQVQKKVEKRLEASKIGDAAQLLYDFVWGDFCDWFIEFTKQDLRSADPVVVARAQYVLMVTLAQSLKLLHPFVPFVTEAIWEHFGHRLQTMPTDLVHSPLLITAKLGSLPDIKTSTKLQQKVSALQMIISQLREKKQQLGATAKGQIYVKVVEVEAVLGEFLLSQAAYLSALAGVLLVAAEAKVETNRAIKISAGTVVLELLFNEESADAGQQKQKLQAELTEVEQRRVHSEQLLGNVNFTGRAPEAVVAAEQAKLEQLQQLQMLLQEQIKKL